MFMLNVLRTSISIVEIFKAGKLSYYLPVMFQSDYTEGHTCEVLDKM